MAHFAILCPDEAGHLISIGSVGRELVRRGHRVTVVGRAKAAPVARQLDLPLHQLDTAGLRYPFNPVTWFLLRIFGAAWIVVVRNMLRWYAEEVLRLVPQAFEDLKVDGVLVDHIVSAGGTAAERAGVPFVTVCSALLWHEEPGIPPPFTSWGLGASRWTRLRNRLGFAALHGYVAPVMRKLNRYRAAWGMPRIRRVSDVYSPLAQISQLCPGFDFPRKELPDVFHYIGSLGADRKEEGGALFPWEKLDGRPLMFASLGTVPYPTNVPVYRRIAAACEGLDAQLVLTLGRWNEAGDRMREALGGLPGNHLVVNFAPQLALLDKASLLITNAGVNTVLEGICRGVPMVALPRTTDQTGMGSRIEHSGVGLRAPYRRGNPEQLRAMIQRVLSEDRFRQRARELQKTMLAAGGLCRAADIAEEAFATRRPVKHRGT